MTATKDVSGGGGLVGWYYLHTNGDLIFKCELGETAADIRESDFARCMWPMRPDDRAGAWDIAVEGLALGARKERVAELAGVLCGIPKPVDPMADREGR